MAQRTAYATACEVSRELGLGLSNAEVEALASLLSGLADQGKAERDLIAKGRQGVREIVRAARAA